MRDQDNGFRFATRTVRKQNNDKYWAKFVESARSPHGIGVRYWYLSNHGREADDCVLLLPSDGRVIGAFEVAKQAGHLENVFDVTAVTDESVTVVTVPYGCDI